MNNTYNQLLIEIDQITDDNKLVSILELIISKIEINTTSEMARIENKTPRGIKVSNQYRKIKIGKQTMIVKGVKNNNLPF